MKLWIFGDSYAQDHQDATQWPHLLADHYQCDIEFDADAGRSNERILWGLQQAQDRIQSQDLAVVVTTDCFRRWFWEDYPQYSNYYNLKEINMPNRAANWNALEHYTRYLVNPTADIINYECHLAWLSTLDCNTVVVPGFRNLPTEHALTEDVSEQEFADALHQQMWRQRGSDTRLNHLSPHNHIVLADKIRRVIDGEGELDLTQDFYRNFLTV